MRVVSIGITSRLEMNLRGGKREVIKMPRVAIRKKDYKVQDLSVFIVGKMYAKNLRQADMAELLDMTQPAFSYRLKNGQFSYAQMLTILQKIDATDEEILRLMKM